MHDTLLCFFFLQANQGLNIKELCVRSIFAGFCFHTYQQVTLLILYTLTEN